MSQRTSTSTSTSTSTANSTSAHLPITGSESNNHGRVTNMNWNAGTNTVVNTQTGSHLPQTGKHLPQTGTQDQHNATNAGLGFLGLAGLFGFLRKKKNHKEQN